MIKDAKVSSDWGLAFDSDQLAADTDSDQDRKTTSSTAQEPGIAECKEGLKSPFSQMKRSEPMVADVESTDMFRYVDMGDSSRADTFGSPGKKDIRWRWSKTKGRKLSNESFDIDNAPGNDVGVGLDQEFIANAPKFTRLAEIGLSSRFTRRFHLVEACEIFSMAVLSNIRILSFCKTRRMVELFLEKAREIVRSTNEHIVSQISSYRGGYVKEYRREIERNVSTGFTNGLISTNALEMGIDIGNLDITIHTGFPSSVSSLWQQIGRCGRSQEPSVSILVLAENPCDQFLAKHPNFIFERPYEPTLLDPFDDIILKQHLQCAANEIPLNTICVGSENVDELIWGEAYIDTVKSLIDSGDCFVLSEGGRKYVASSSKTCAKQVNIRSINDASFEVIDAASGMVLDNIEYSRAFYEIYEGSVYLNRGYRYVVTKMDFEDRKAYCRKLTRKLTYHTKIECLTSVSIITVCKSERKVSPGRSSNREGHNQLFGEVTCATGRIRIVKSGWELQKISNITGSVIEETELHMPNLEFETNAFWVDIMLSGRSVFNCDEVNLEPLAIHAANHVLASAAAIVLQCDMDDICCLHSGERLDGIIRLLLYDGHSGGTGVSKAIYSMKTEIFERAVQLSTECNCNTNGCPACVHSKRCPLENHRVSRSASLILLRAALQAALFRS
jgi:ATP-dependent helicase YprA (DUF1998 family)